MTSLQKERVTVRVSGALVFLLLTPLILLLISFSACQLESQPKDLLETIQERGYIIAGVDFDSRPFGYMDEDGVLKGFDVDLLTEITKRILGSADAIEFKQVLSSTRIAALSAGRLDVSAATMTITPEREELIDFSDSYFTAHQAVLVPINSPVRELDDLGRRTIAYIHGTTSERNIKRRFPQAKFIGSRSTAENFDVFTEGVQSGQVDALTDDNTMIAGFLLAHCGYRPLEDWLSDEPYGLGFKQSTSTHKFRMAVNHALEEMKTDGTLDRLEEKWVKTSLTAKPCRR